jgi:hypothetical protein
MKLFRGKKYKYIHTRDIYLDDIRAVFFPKNFWEKYRYLGIVPYKEEGRIFDALLPLVLLMDYDSKPWWCPRWFLRFLHLFGNDNSVVKVRNWKLHRLFTKLTKNNRLLDYKTKWSDNDLRIHAYGSERVMNLADDIERGFYSRYKKDVDFN